MIVAGVMSGTSADGIDVALVRILGNPSSPHLKLIAHYHRPYPRRVRDAVLAAMDARAAAVRDLARLNFLLGELYAEAIIAALRHSRGARIDLIGCHGQTLYHQGEPETHLGKKLSATWQTGEGAVVAARLGVPVVSDFRPADLAVGGKGAPLVPLLDYTLFRHPSRGRILQNIGGIANLTAIPAVGRPRDVLAFDTGPGNMVIDAAMQQLFGQPYDRDGRVASEGHVLENVLSAALRSAFFKRRPPKTAGREQFGAAFADNLIHYIHKSSHYKRNADVIATLTALTAHSIAGAVGFCNGGTFQEMIVSGGGTRNKTLMRMLSEQLRPMRIAMRTSDEFGVPTQAKEAMAFGLLAYRTWNRKPGNLPGATGAKSPAVLGKISFPPIKT